MFLSAAAKLGLDDARDDVGTAHLTEWRGVPIRYTRLPLFRRSPQNRLNPNSLEATLTAPKDVLLRNATFITMDDARSTAAEPPLKQLGAGRPRILVVPVRVVGASGSNERA